MATAHAPRPLVFYLDEIITDNETLPVLCNRDGTILTKQHWMQLRESINRTYDVLSESDISDLNMQGLPISAPIRLEPSGFVYVIYLPNAFKIGVTTNIRNRLKYFKTHSSTEPKLIKTFYVPAPVRIENALHQKFKTKHKHGEWFDLTSDDISWITAQNDSSIQEILDEQNHEASAS